MGNFLELAQNWLGLDVGVSPRRMRETVWGERCVTGDMAQCLARNFAIFGVGLQMNYDLDMGIVLGTHRTRSLVCDIPARPVRA